MALKPVYWTLRAVLAARSSWMMGPLLRRGTISVAGGIAARRDHGEVVGVPEPGLFCRKVSGMGMTGSSRPWYTVARPLGEDGSGRSCSA